MQFDCIVIGAGLAGLTAARDLEDAGKSVLLIESNTEVGGRVRSDYQDDFIFDHGFQVINPRYPEVARSKIIKKLDFCYISGSIRLADSNKKIGYNLASFSPEIAGVSEKLNLVKFIFSGKVSNNKSFAEYLDKFPELYQKVLKPFLSGVFLTDPATIAADVAQDILRSFVKSLPGVPANGVGQFSKALANSLQNIKTTTKVEKILGNTVFTNSGEFFARNVVIATDPNSAQTLVPTFKPPKMLKSTTMYFSNSEELANARNLVISANSKLVNSIVMNKVSPNYAPPGKNLVSATSLLPLSESEFKTELSAIWGCDCKTWDVLARYEIDKSLPFHPPGKNRIQNLQIGENLFMIGDHMNSPSQQGAMRSGALVAGLINQLKR